MVLVNVDLHRSFITMRYTVQKWKVPDWSKWKYIHMTVRGLLMCQIYQCSLYYHNYRINHNKQTGMTVAYLLLNTPCAECLQMCGISNRFVDIIIMYIRQNLTNITNRKIWV